MSSIKNMYRKYKEIVNASGLYFGIEIESDRKATMLVKYDPSSMEEELSERLVVSRT